MQSRFQPTSDATRGRDIYTVSRLNREVRSILEGSFPLIWLEGEISNLARPGSGHWYFTLKDEAAQVRCAMFRNRNMLVKNRPENGMQVLVRARIGLYEARGEYQIIIEHMEDAGEGTLRREFEQLKNKLQQAGLFDTEHKQNLPTLPRRIGIITSPTGAVVHDIMTTLKRRFTGIPVVIYPVPVQGEGAAEKIAAMIRLAARRNECDVLLLARGGGSLEDLWAFNKEVVARAIFDCPIPIVSAVGHETDVTIADFVADQRAPTPTAAAELVSPDQSSSRSRLAQLGRRLQNTMQNHLLQHAQQLNNLNSRLPSPLRNIETGLQRLDELEYRRNQAMQHLLRHHRSHIRMLFERLQQFSPLQRLQQFRLRNDALGRRLTANMKFRLQRHAQQIQHLAHSLDTVSPLATLSRGYAIVTDETNERVIRSCVEVKTGDTIHIRLAKGRLTSKVTQTHDK